MTLLGGAASRGRSRRARSSQKGGPHRLPPVREPAREAFNAFRDGLRALGYVEGRNIFIEQRYAAGAVDRLGPLAAELVRMNADVIVVDGSASAKAAKAATATIPVVFSLATDPEAEGLVASMARPGQISLA